MDDSDFILGVIKLERVKLAQLVQNSDRLVDEEVVRKSQEIDELVTKYYKTIGRSSSYLKYA